MATPESLAEVSAATLAMQAAVARIGAATVAEALEIWKRMSAKDPQGTAAAWMEDAIEMVMSRRGQSRELTLAFYRLTRALVTGSTVPDPHVPEPTQVTLGELRTAFAELAESVLPPDDGRDDLLVPVEPSDAAVAPLRTSEKALERDDAGVDLVDLTEDELLDAIREDIRETGAEQDEDDLAAEEELRIVMEALGKKGLIKRIQGLDDPSDDELAEAKSQSGARQAAAAERIALNGGRGDEIRRAKNDPRVIGYVRYSKTGSPCGWCAVLISRGLTLYRDELSATVAKDGELFHDNCHCAARAVFSKEQYDSDENYDNNRLYGEWWPDVTHGTGGKFALGLWRKFFALTGEMPDGERLAYWNKWLDSPEGERFEKALSKRVN